MEEIPSEWRLFFEFMAHTGLRIGEMIEVRWGRDLVVSVTPVLHVRWQFADGQVREPKNRHGKRDIPISPRFLGRLLVPVNASPVDGELVFRTSTGTRVDRRNIYNHVLGPAAKRAGLDWVTLHTFRHICASLLFAPEPRRRRQERQAGPGLARTPLGRLHAASVRPPRGRRNGGGGLLR